MSAAVTLSWHRATNPSANSRFRVDSGGIIATDRRNCSSSALSNARSMTLRIERLFAVGFGRRCSLVLRPTGVGASPDHQRSSPASPAPSSLQGDAPSGRGLYTGAQPAAMGASVRGMGRSSSIHVPAARRLQVGSYHALVGPQPHGSTHSLARSSARARCALASPSASVAPRPERSWWPEPAAGAHGAAGRPQRFDPDKGEPMHPTETLDFVPWADPDIDRYEHHPNSELSRMLWLPSSDPAPG